MAEDICIGDVFSVEMTAEEGITPHSGFSSRRKFFIVLGVTTNGVAYGGTVFNSHINLKLPPLKQMYQMPILYERYPFLSHRSYVDCSSLKRVRVDKLSQAEKLGVILPDDLDLIVSTICSCPLIRRAELEMYGMDKSSQ